MARSTADGSRWLNRTVLGIGLASLFSDWSHEIATAVLPAFIATMGGAAAWLGLIEGVSDGLWSFAKLASGYYTDRLRRRKTIAVAGYLVTALGTASFGLARPVRALGCVVGPGGANASAQSTIGRFSYQGYLWAGVWFRAYDGYLRCDRRSGVGRAFAWAPEPQLFSAFPMDADSRHACRSVDCLPGG